MPSLREYSKLKFALGLYTRLNATFLTILSKINAPSLPLLSLLSFPSEHLSQDNDVPESELRGSKDSVFLCLLFSLE